MTRPPFDPPTDADVAVVSAQLGRPARGVIGIAARCVCGNPTVVATHPRLPDGTPFPTLYYLTHPAATAAISTLEATQVMNELSELLDDEVARWADPAYIESQARDRLYYVYPGDISYLVIGDGPAQEPADELPISDTIQATRVDWMSALLSSIYTAGLTDATPEQLEGTVDAPAQSDGAVG